MDTQNEFTKENVKSNNSSGTSYYNNGNQTGTDYQTGTNYQSGYNNQAGTNFQAGYNNQAGTNFQAGYNNQAGYNYQTGYNNYPNGYNYQSGYNQAPQNGYGATQSNTNGLAVASLILGIISGSSTILMFTGLAVWFWISLLSALLATILGGCSKNKTGPFAGSRPGSGVAGLVLGIIMLVIDIFLIIIALAFISRLSGSLRGLY